MIAMNVIKLTIYDDYDFYEFRSLFLQDKREASNPNVSVAVFSTISTNLSPVSDFRIEVSVPKVTLPSSFD